MKKSQSFMIYRKIIGAVAFLLVSILGEAQVRPGYTKVYSRYTWLSGAFDSSLHIPSYNGVPTGRRGGMWGGSAALGADTVNHVLYLYSDSVWRAVSGDNIYNTNGTLTSNRTLTGDANSLTFTGLSSFLTAIGSTTRLSLNSTSSVMQSPDGQNYVEATDTSININTQNNYLQITDTELRLDTLTRDPGIWDLRWNPTTKKITYSDTAALGGKMNISDTANMLANYLITASDLSPLFTTSESGHNITFTGSNVNQYEFLGRVASGSGAYIFTRPDTSVIENFYTKVRSLFTAGTGITITNGQIASTVTGGTVTSLTATDANGFDFTITDPTTAPNISLTTSVTNTRVIYSNSGAVAGISGVTSDGTNMTAGSENLRATSPRIVTGINDTNGNELLLLTATGSAVNELTLANAATGSNPSLTASGSDSNIGFDYISKGTGSFNLVGNSTQAAQIRLYEDTDNGTNYTAFQVGSQSANLTYTLPTAYPGVSGYALTSTDAGVMSWAALTTGTVTSIATAGLISGGTITGSGTITTSMATNKLVGRGTAGTGIMEEITLGTNLSLSGTTLNATDQYVGTVTSVSATDGNGFNFTITNGTTTPDIALTTTVPDNRIMYSDGTGVAGESNFTFTGQAIQFSSTNTTETTTNAGISASFNSLTSGDGMYLTSNSLTDGSILYVVETSAAVNESRAIEVQMSGVNSSSSAVSYGIFVHNSHTGTTPANYAYYGRTSPSSGGTGVVYYGLANTSNATNYGAWYSATGGGTATNTALRLEANGGSSGNYALYSTAGLIYANTGNTTQNGVEFSTATTTGKSMYINSAGLSTGTGLHLNTSSTALGAGNELLSITMSGANASSSITATGGRISVTNTGTTSTNVGLEVTASGASTNYAVIVPASGGRVGIGTSAPDSTFQVTGGLKFVTGNQGANKVLTSAAGGGADWAAVPRYTPLVVSSASETSLTINADITDIYTLTAQTDNITFNNPTGTLVQGQKLIIRIKEDGTGPFTITWGSAFREGSTALPTATLSSTKTQYCGFLYNSTDSKWDMVAYIAGF